MLKKCSKACLCVIHLHQNIKACYYGFMTVLVFGVFDILHPGHIYFLDQVIQLGGDLHICLASDEYVKNYKNRPTVKINTINNTTTDANIEMADKK